MRRLHLAFVTLGDHSYAGLVVDERIHHACGVHRSTVGRACAGGVWLSGAGDIGAQLRAVSRVPRMQRSHYGPRYFRSDTVATHRHNGGVRRGALCLNSTRCLVHDGRVRAVERADVVTFQPPGQILLYQTLSFVVAGTHFWRQYPQIALVVRQRQWRKFMTIE